MYHELRKRGTSRGGWLVCAAVVIAALPFIFQDSYWRATLVLAAINVILALGLDFILGYGGQLNLRPSAFFGIGAPPPPLLFILGGGPVWVGFFLALAASGIARMGFSL